MIWRSVMMVIRAAGTETRESHAGSRSSAKKCDVAWRSIRTPCSRKQRTGSPLRLMNEKSAEYSGLSVAEREESGFIIGVSLIDTTIPWRHRRSGARARWRSAA